MLSGASDTTLTDLDAVSGRQDDIHEANLGELVQYATWLISQARLATELRQGLPEYVRQKADQDVRQHSILFLVPDRSDAQIGFMDPERGFRLGQLHVRLPEFFVRPVEYIGSQQIAAGTQRSPVAKAFDLLPL